MAMRSRSRQLKSVAKIGLLPSLFNINEPILFGFPVIMNPVFLLPFLFVPLINACIAWYLTQLGILDRAVAVLLMVDALPAGGGMVGERQLEKFVHEPFAASNAGCSIAPSSKYTNVSSRKPNADPLAVGDLLLVRLMQRSAAQIGAVIPGWKDIRLLGGNVLQVTADDLFPKGCITLRGIKPVRKEDIELAIIYSASMLATAPTATPCFCHWQQSLLLQAIPSPALLP